MLNLLFPTSSGATRHLPLEGKVRNTTSCLLYYPVQGVPCATKEFSGVRGEVACAAGGGCSRQNEVQRSAIAKVRLASQAEPGWGSPLRGNAAVGVPSRAPQKDTFTKVPHIKIRPPPQRI